eukprot:TRINITY_DN8320_c0_g1_i1.p1 TRINITY_DN8320_c0_g1~~TRINITY_DN8320_c0_g1_i1.p1  ORF type:complete len:343 (-),score=78.42 TRINITY_DN8320_c0_g1_i1:460-1467(-)
MNENIDGKPLKRSTKSKKSNDKNATKEFSNLEIAQYEIIKILSTISDKIQVMEENVNSKVNKLSEDVSKIFEILERIEEKSTSTRKSKEEVIEKRKRTNSSPLNGNKINTMITSKPQPTKQFLTEELSEDEMVPIYSTKSRGTTANIMRDPSSSNDDLEIFSTKKTLAPKNERGVFSNMHLTSLPNELPNIQKIYLDHNKLETLSKVDFVKFRTQCSHLTVLVVNNNELIEIAKEIQLIVNLQILLLQNNHLKELPNTIGKLKNLRILNISHNQITSLPETITELASIEKFDLSFNGITQLPMGFSSLKLKEFMVEGNPIKNLLEILKNGGENLQ